MNRLFLIALSNQYDVKVVTDFLDKREEITFWFFNLPHAVFVKSSLPADALRILIQDHLGEHYIFIVEIKKGTDYSGLVPKEHAEYFENLE